MKAEFVIAANSSSVDMNTNQLSIFDLIDELEITFDRKAENPIVPFLFQLIASVLREETDPAGKLETTLRIVLRQPNGETKEQTIPIRYESHHVRNRIRVSTTLNISVGGTYTIELQTEDRKSLGSKSIPVKILQPPV